MKKARRFRQFEKRHLKFVLGAFFFALIIPTAFLVYQAYDQIKWEAFHQQRQLAEEVALRIDNEYISLINTEEQRAFTDYSFLNIAGDSLANVVQRSPLSSLDHRSPLKGMIGYFQIDEKGQFTSPLLPVIDSDFSSYGISKKEYALRELVQNRVQDILKTNELIRPQRGTRLARKEVPAATPLKKSKPVPEPAPMPRKDEPEPVSASDVVTAAAQDLGKAVAQASSPILEQESPGEIGTAEDDYSTQSGFDKLARQDDQPLPEEKSTGKYSLGKLEDLQLEKKYDADLRAQQQKAQVRRKTLKEQVRKKRQSKRKEQNILPEAAYAPKDQFSDNKPESSETVKIEIFESEIDPFEFNLLKSGEFVLFRKAWRNENRYIQGILFDSKNFIDQTILPVFKGTTLAQASDLAIAYNGDIFSVVGGKKSSRYQSTTAGLNGSAELKGALLYRTRLSPPLNDIELVFSIRNLPTGPGGRLITWTTLILFVILCAGFLLMYRLGARQISLGQQQQDFVSAVSHELKTPLTSIRMYGEMLREGWASDEKKKSYYDYIYYESERLSRLIQNVLQLARMTRNDVQIELGHISVNELIDTIRSKITSHIERNDFALELNCSEQAGLQTIKIDQDYFSQIIINLVDNAIKFSRDTENKRIEISCYCENDNVTFSIRDFGPGIAKDQLKKIFSLFYRSENELTRKTVGTGIGLALVHQLTAAMHGNIDVINHQPGAEFILSFPITRSD